tara:strand:- start:2236 stop:5406 length:3171 start_codon:yes stop_codon:yes gene_type:complete
METKDFMQEIKLLQRMQSKHGNTPEFRKDAENLLTAMFEQYKIPANQFIGGLHKELDMEIKGKKNPKRGFNTGGMAAYTPPEMPSSNIAQMSGTPAIAEMMTPPPVMQGFQIDSESEQTPEEQLNAYKTQLEGQHSQYMTDLQSQYNKQMNALTERQNSTPAAAETMQQSIKDAKEEYTDPLPMNQPDPRLVTPKAQSNELLDSIRKENLNTSRGVTTTTDTGLVQGQSAQAPAKAMASAVTSPTTAPGGTAPAPDYGSNPNVNIPSTPTTPSSNQNIQAAVDKGFVYQAPEGYSDDQIPQYQQQMSEGVQQTLGDDFDKFLKLEKDAYTDKYSIKWKDYSSSVDAPQYIADMMGGRGSVYSYGAKKGQYFDSDTGKTLYSHNRPSGTEEEVKNLVKNMPIYSGASTFQSGQTVYSEDPVPLFNEDGTPMYQTDADGNLIVTGYETRPATIGSMTAQDAVDPHLQGGEQIIPAMIQESADQYLDAGGDPIPRIDENGQFLYDENGNMLFETDADGNTILTETTGMVGGTVAVDPTLAGTTYADNVTETDANVVTATDAKVGTTAVDNVLDDVEAQTGTAQKMDAAQSAKKPLIGADGNPVLDAQGQPVMTTSSDVSNLNAAAGVAAHIDSAATREIQEGELISGAANAEKASQFIEGVQAATADPTEQATVRGQLAQLTANFDASNPPSWAAGALRGVTEKMAARGIGASSIFGQAMIQSALESALPIAQADAQTFGTFELANLSNRQAMQMVYAEQRAAFMGMEFDQEFKARVANATKIADIADRNHTAEQQVILENAAMTQTMNLENVRNKQALIIQEAAAIASLEQKDLDARQQAAVVNAQHLLQMDMANLANAQQTELFKAAEQIQAMFTDKAAENAANQFNAASQNQTDQFFANLGQATNQFNATQANAQAQFNAGQVNTVERFNAELNNQRDQFNAQNQLVIAQSNAVWKRAIATADTASINNANEMNAKALLGISQQAYENLWQYYGDTMEWAWTSTENERARIVQMAIADLNATTEKELGNLATERAEAQSWGSAAASVVGSVIDFIF